MSLTPRIDSLERQYIINGGLDFIQRWGLSLPANFVGASNGGYFFDRIRCETQGSTSKDVTISLSTDAPSYTQTGYRAIRSALFTNNTSVSVASDDAYYPFEYRMEGYDYRYIHGRQITLGFWFKASLAGIYSIALVAGVGGNRSYVTSFTYANAGTWTFVSKTITMDTVDASYDFVSGLALYINIAMASGSAGVTSTLDQWQSGTKFMASTATHWETTAGATIQACLFQLVRGPSLDPTAFSLYGGHFNGELIACQRYFEKSYHPDLIPGTATIDGMNSFNTWGSVNFASGDPTYSTKFLVNKRDIPNSVVLFSTGGAINTIRKHFTASDYAASGQYLGVQGFIPTMTHLTGGTWEVYEFQYTADAEL